MHDANREPTAAYAYEALLRYNFFPLVKNRRDDIPPVFHSEQFTPQIADELIAAKESQNRKEGFDQIAYRVNRFDNTIRRMDIPHPLPFARLSKCLSDNWAKLDYVYTSAESQIKPKRHAGRLVVMHDYDCGRLVILDNQRFGPRMEQFLQLTTGSLYRTIADVANCFPSMYTHAIPWALVGHAPAKQDRNKKEKWFNKLDFFQRSMKRHETIGIPVGPASSNVIAEIVLCRIDEKLRELGYRFVRFIDDYHCYTKSEEQAEKFLRDLDLALDDFQLKLNRKKIRVDRLPQPANASWLDQILVAIGETDKVSQSQMATLLDTSLKLHRQYEDANVLKYAATVLSKKLDSKNALLFFSYLLQFGFHHSTVLPIAAEVLKKYKLVVSESIAIELIKTHLEYHRSDAVCWSLLIAKLSGIAVPDELAEAIILSKDVMSIGMLLAMQEHLDKIDGHLMSLPIDDVYTLDQNWILIFERSRPEGAVRSRFAAYCGESGLTILREKGIRFIDQTQLEVDEAKQEAAEPLYNRETV